MVIIPAKIDLTGKRFGRLVVVKEIGRTRIGKQSAVNWLCKCDCGNYCEVPAGRLTSGNTKSCGCLAIKAREDRARDITGQRFGRLVATRRLGKSKNGHSLWECKCDCGNMATVSMDNLCSGATRSCGCLRREVSGDSHRIDGRSTERLYRVWRGMIERCEDKTHISFVWRKRNFGLR